jgi:hypothetical protein
MQDAKETRQPCELELRSHAKAASSCNYSVAVQESCVWRSSEILDAQLAMDLNDWSCSSGSKMGLGIATRNNTIDEGYTMLAERLHRPLWRVEGENLAEVVG